MLLPHRTDALTSTRITRRTKVQLALARSPLAILIPVPRRRRHLPPEVVRLPRRPSHHTTTVVLLHLTSSSALVKPTILEDVKVMGPPLVRMVSEVVNVEWFGSCLLLSSFVAPEFHQVIFSNSVSIFRTRGSRTRAIPATQILCHTSCHPYFPFTLTIFHSSFHHPYSVYDSHCSPVLSYNFLHQKNPYG